MLVYTVNNIPYSALCGVMTGDSVERTSLASWRFIAAMTATFIVQTFTPVFVSRFGGGNQELGYQLTVGLYAVLMVVCFVATFLTTRERVQPDPKQSTSVGQDLKDLLAIGPWWALFMLALFTFVNLALRGGTTLYYFNYFVDGKSFVSWFNDWESRTFGRELFSMQTTHILSLFNGLGIATTLVGVIMSTWLAGRFGKRNVFLVCLFLSASFIGLFVFIPADAMPCDVGVPGALQSVVWRDDSVVVGDDGGRGGLLGMAHGTTGDGDGLRDDDVCVEHRAGDRSGAERLAVAVVRLRREAAGAVGAGGARDRVDV